MIRQKFSKGEALRFGWETTKSNLVFFVGVLIIAFLVLFVLAFISKLMEGKNALAWFIITIACGILFIIIRMGFIKITLRFYNNEKAKFSDLFSCYPLLFKYILGLIFYGIIVLGGFILFVVTGIIWGIEYQFFEYFIVDKKLGPIEALRRSSEITRGAKWDLFLFDLLIQIINLLGSICLILGLFVTLPLTMVARTSVYYQLLTRQTEVTQVLGSLSGALSGNMNNNQQELYNNK